MCFTVQRVLIYAVEISDVNKPDMETVGVFLCCLLLSEIGLIHAWAFRLPSSVTYLMQHIASPGIFDRRHCSAECNVLMCRRYTVLFL